MFGVDPIAQQGAAGRQYFLGDALGNVRQLADSAGEITLVQNYHPYCEVAFTSVEGSNSYGFTAEMAVSQDWSTCGRDITHQAWGVF